MLLIGLMNVKLRHVIMPLIGFRKTDRLALIPLHTRAEVQVVALDCLRPGFADPIEFSVLSKPCLDRRIATKDELRQEVCAVVKEREEKAIKIDWQFSIASARSKLNRHYQQINAENAQYQKLEFHCTEMVAGFR